MESNTGPIRVRIHDTRYCYSATCSWHGPITEVGKTKPIEGVLVKAGNRIIPPISLPCCPFCGSMLFEMPTQKEWDEGASVHESQGHTHYVAFLAWTRLQKRCWPSLREASVKYALETGNEVVWDL